jgi:hypothetical protein
MLVKEPDQGLTNGEVLLSFYFVKSISIYFFKNLEFKICAYFSPALMVAELLAFFYNSLNGSCKTYLGPCNHLEPKL